LGEGIKGGVRSKRRAAGGGGRAVKRTSILGARYIVTWERGTFSGCDARSKRSLGHLHGGEMGMSLGKEGQLLKESVQMACRGSELYSLKTPQTAGGRTRRGGDGRAKSRPIKNWGKGAGSHR